MESSTESAQTAEAPHNAFRQRVHGETVATEDAEIREKGPRAAMQLHGFTMLETSGSVGVCDVDGNCR